MSKKKQSREERLEKKKIAERRRKERIKSYPGKAEELRRKDRERYYKKKQEKKVIPIRQLPPREKRRAQRKKKHANKMYYEKKKRLQILASNNENNINATVETPISTRSLTTGNEIVDSPHFQSNRSRVIHDVTPRTPHSVRYSRRLRSRQDSSITSDNEPHVTNLTRNIFTSNPNHTQIQSPSVSAISSIRSVQSSPCYSPTSDSSISSTTFTSEVIKKFKKYKYKKAKETQLLQLRIIQLRKEKDNYRKRAVRAEKSINTKKLIKPVQTTHQTKPITTSKENGITRLRNTVIKFLEEDENSRMCPGKNDYITKHKQKKQKRYLIDSLKNLHSKYISSGYPPVKYASFCRMRPFWVKQPDLSTRNTCLCKIHANMELLIAALKKFNIINENCTSEILTTLCCDKDNVECLLRQCQNCKNRKLPTKDFENSSTMVYWFWEKISKTYIKDDEEKNANAVEKVRHVAKPIEVLTLIEKLLPQFLIHCGNIKNQYRSIKQIKDNLSQNECLIHIDYSENYCTKYGEEIQSVHFGGSRQQLTLHTAVIYYHVGDERKTQAFCTISSSLRHDAPAVWAHLVPILTEIDNLTPHVTTLHIVSDSPSAQYRNKKIFYIISQLKSYCPNINCIAWHYCECGHGKGAPDGVGGVLKRTADQFVAYGNDITNVESLIEYLQTSVSAVTIKQVEDYEITEKDWLIPDELDPFPGTMKVHQAVWTNNPPLVISLRTLSCVKPQCLNNNVICSHVSHSTIHNSSNQFQSNQSLCKNRNLTKLLRLSNNAEAYILKSNRKPIPCTVTTKDTIPNDENPLNSTILSRNIEDIASDAVPDSSFFKNISTGTLQKFEQTQVPTYNSDTDSDLDIFNVSRPKNKPKIHTLIDYDTDSDLDIF